MAKTTRQRILSGSSPRSTEHESASSLWSRLVSGSSPHMPPGRRVERLRNRFNRNQSLSEEDVDEDMNASADARSNSARQPTNISAITDELGPYKKSVKTLLEAFDLVQPALYDVRTHYLQHVHDVEAVQEIAQENDELKTELAERENEVKSLQNSIESLSRRNDGELKSLAASQQAAEAERERLANEHVKVRDEFESRKEDLMREMSAQREKLEREFQKKDKIAREKAEKEVREAVEESKRERKDLKKDLQVAEERIKEFKRRNHEFMTEKEALVQNNTDLKRLKEYLEIENRKLEEKVQDVTARFACYGHPLEEYRAEFNAIQRRIQLIANKYLRNFENVQLKEIGPIHEKLGKNDALFKGVPISGSEDSALLCRAHIQRIIAQNITRTIWKPFSCDRLLRQPAFSGILLEIQERIAASTHSGSHQEVFWRVQTSQACQSAGSPDKATAATVVADSPEPEGAMSRSEKAYASIDSTIRPLINPDMINDFQDSLMEILRLSVNVWDRAATDEKTFEVESSLTPDLYAACRSDEFDPDVENWNTMEDPALLPNGISTTTPDSRPASKALLPEEILVLFPRIRSLQPVYNEDIVAGRNMPGSFPEGHDGLRHTLVANNLRSVELVHSGAALATTSRLALSGKAEVEKWKIEEEDTKEKLFNLLETKRLQDRTRRQSMASSGATLVGGAIIEDE